MDHYQQNIIFVNQFLYSPASKAGENPGELRCNFSSGSMKSLN